MTQHLNNVLLAEATKNELINKSKTADIVKAYGSTRWERRNKQNVFNSVSAYNKIDMNALFRADMLSFKIPVHGETDDYEVEVLFTDILKDIKSEIKKNNLKLEYKCVYKAILSAIDTQDILVACTCPDFKYRQAYYASKGGYNGGAPEIRPSKITNPHDTKGGGCKHIMCILGNLDWALKLATAIYNYIIYMERNYEARYATIIFPTIFDGTYQEYTKTKKQYGTGDKELANPMVKSQDKDIIDKANKSGIKL